MSNKDIPPVRTEKEDLDAFLKKSIEYIPNWQEEGTCWNTQDEMWFIPDRSSMLQVAEICLTQCEVRLNCLQRGIGEDYRGIFQPGGVWGGYIPEQRANLKKKLEQTRK